MKNKSRLHAVSLSVFVCLMLFPAALSAGELLSANDLDPAALTSNAAAGPFTLYATAEKPMSVDALTEETKAEDGEIFNSRINLKGGGAATYRSVGFKAKANAEVTLYSLSSSKTDARALIVVNAASGATVAELSAPPYEGNQAKVFKIVLAEAGDYFVWSKTGGMYIYQIEVK